MHHTASYHERLVTHVRELERLEEIKALAAEDVKEAFTRAKADGFDPTTLRIVLRLRKMTPSQRQERRALEAIYLAELGMLDGDPLPDEARRRLDGKEAAPPAARETRPSEAVPPASPPAPRPEQAPLALKDPTEARQEGEAAAEAGRRIYDNPYPAGDPCRAAWDEGWCAKRRSTGMDLPAAYQRRSAKPPEPPASDRKDDGTDADRRDDGSADAEEGAA